MDRLTRNALRLGLAGAGLVVLGAGFLGQASADEEPTGQPDVQDVANVVPFPLGAPDEG